jgi:ethanolamine ammonia-lyase small subunit
LQNELTNSELQELESSIVAPSGYGLPWSRYLQSTGTRTPARIFAGRTGASYRTATWLTLRSDHAAAKDAVWAELDLNRDLGKELVAQWELFEVSTRACTKREFLHYPDLGRHLSCDAQTKLLGSCPMGSDIQVAIADGLSANAVLRQVPMLLPLLAAEAHRQGWRFGQPFVIRYGRVGVLNDIGEILKPSVAVLLIGERPGLATVDSLSAYLAFRPRAGHDDACRNVISNIHCRGTTPVEACPRIINLARQMIQLQTSGLAIKEQLVVPIE